MTRGQRGSLLLSSYRTLTYYILPVLTGAICQPNLEEETPLGVDYAVGALVRRIDGLTSGKRVRSGPVSEVRDRPKAPDFDDGARFARASSNPARNDQQARR